MWDNLMNTIADFFMAILWGICQGIMWILNTMHEAFYFLAGVETLPFQIPGQAEEVNLT